MLEKISFDAHSIDLFMDVTEQVFKQNQVNHSNKSRMLRGEMEKLRQRLSRAQQLMLDSEMRMDEYRGIKSKTESEINRLEIEYLQFEVKDPNYPKYVAFGRTILKDLSYYYTEGGVS